MENLQKTSRLEIKYEEQLLVFLQILLKVKNNI